MKKVFLADFIFSKGHRINNTTFASAISENAKVIAIDNGENYFKEKIPKAEIITVKNKFTENSGRFSARLKFLSYMKEQYNLQKMIKPDVIIVQTYDVIAFSFSKFYKKNMPPVYIFHHHNTDELSNKIKLYFFKKYMNRVNHIVLDDYIKDYLVNEIGVESNRVFVVYHPLRPMVPTDEVENNIEKKLFIALSNSNDQNIVNEIINYEQKTNILLKNGIKLIVKSKNHSINSESLQVYNSNIPNEKYENYLKQASKIILPFPQAFKYRCSGTLYDAISRNKTVLASNVLFFKKFSEKYPETCKIFDTVPQLFELMTNDSAEVQCLAERNEIFRIHGFQGIVEQLNEIINNI